MSFDESNIWLAVGVFLALVTTPVVSVAQSQPERVTFRASKECSSPDAVETLRQAIAVRLGERARLVESVQEYAVLWTSSGSGCRLLVETPSTTTPVSLASKSDPDAIRNAASRVAWLLANAEPVTPGRPTEGSETGGPEPETEPEPEPEPETEPEPEPEDPVTPGRPTEGSETGDPEPYHEVNVRLGFFPGMGAPFGRGPHVSRIAFNIIGWQAGVRELEFGLLANIDTDFVQGAQFAGGANVSLGRTDGLAVAGLTNVSTGVHDGQQISGLFNFAKRLGGLQVAPVNQTGAEMEGGQVGAINLAAGVSGVQFGGLNIGKRVEGLQFGLVNIAADADYSLGLVNINYQRPLYVDLWATELGANFVGLRHGSRYVKWMVATGGRPKTSNSRALWSTGVGLGLHMPLDERERFFLESDLIDYFIFAPDPNSNSVALGNHLQFRLNAGWRLASRFALFGGASLNLLFSDATQNDAVTLGGPLVFESGVDSTMTALWPGFQAGVRF